MSDIDVVDKPDLYEDLVKERELQKQIQDEEQILDSINYYQRMIYGEEGKPNFSMFPVSRLEQLLYGVSSIAIQYSYLNIKNIDLYKNKLWVNEHNVCPVTGMTRDQYKLLEDNGFKVDINTFNMPILCRETEVALEEDKKQLVRHSCFSTDEIVGLTLVYGLGSEQVFGTESIHLAVLNYIRAEAYNVAKLLKSFEYMNEINEDQQFSMLKRDSDSGYELVFASETSSYHVSYLITEIGEVPSVTIKSSDPEFPNNDSTFTISFVALEKCIDKLKTYTFFNKEV